MFFCFLTNVFHSKEMPSLLSIASKIAATHMNYLIALRFVLWISELGATASSLW